MSDDTSSIGSTCSQKDLVAAFQSALQEFDGLKVSSIIQQGLDLHHLWTDGGSKYYTALHELVITFVALPPHNRPPKLLAKFLDVLTVLTDNGVDVNDKDARFQHQTALHLASSSPGQTEVIQALLRADARVTEPDQSQQTALHKAAIAGSVENISALISAGADPNVVDKAGFSPLHVAVKRRNSAELMVTLISKGANVDLNHPDHNKQSIGGTPLHLAARFGRVENALTLLDNHAKTDVCDSTGQTALHVAAAHELTGKLCQELLKRGAKVNLCDTIYGETPLHKAVKAGIVENIRALVGADSSCEVNSADFFGNTALHRAASMSRHFDVWHLLLSAGGRVDVPNRDGQTPTIIIKDTQNNVARELCRSY